MINLFRRKKIAAILDIGANTGQYAESILKNFDCEVISFEPMKVEFEIMLTKLLTYNNWTGYNYALGDKEEKTIINILKNSFSSSILDLKKETLKYDEAIGYIDSQEIIVKRLDCVWESLNLKPGNILIKIDTQGYENKVLKGCEKILDKISGIQVELSLIQLYEGELLFNEVFEIIKQLGFSLFIIELGYPDPKTGQLLQLEAVFFRTE